MVEVSYKGVKTVVNGLQNVGELKSHWLTLNNIHGLVKFIHAGKTLPDETILTDSMKMIALVTESLKKDALLQKDLIHAQATVNYQAALKSKPLKKTPISNSIETLTVLEEFSDKNRAMTLLQRIRDDMGIRQIMLKYDWKVNTLEELHPKEATILGFNRNKGQVIALRLRTDDLNGFRGFDSIRKVMIHELAHMVHTDHDASFHALDRDLNGQVDTWNRGQRMDHGRVSQIVELGSDGVRLGGFDEIGSTPNRDLVLNSVMMRLSKEEKSIAKGCGRG